MTHECRRIPENLVFVGNHLGVFGLDIIYDSKGVIFDNEVFLMLNNLRLWLFGLWTDRRHASVKQFLRQFDYAADGGLLVGRAQKQNHFLVNANDVGNLIRG